MTLGGYTAASTPHPRLPFSHPFDKEKPFPPPFGFFLFLFLRVIFMFARALSIPNRFSRYLVYLQLYCVLFLFYISKQLGRNKKLAEKKKLVDVSSIALIAD